MPVVTDGWRWRNVPVPEPYVAGLLAGAVLHVLRPWPIPLDGPLRWTLGGTLSLLGLCLVAWSVRAAGHHDLEAGAALVTEGPYRYSRNPMYVGWGGLYLGLTVAGGLAWPLALFPVVGLAVHRTVRREERRLEEAFGDAYRDYCRNVRRYGL